MRYSIIVAILVCMHLKSFQKCLSKPSTLSRYNFNNTDNSGNSIPDLNHDSRSKYAQQMSSYMNLSINPCEDFYEYACGNWKNVIEEHYTDIQRQNVLDIKYKLDKFIEDILQKSDINDLAPEYADEFEMSKKFYYNCMNAELHPMHKSLKYLNVLNQIGGFPAVNSSWKPEKFSWFNMSAHMTNYGVVGFIKELIANKYPYPPIFTIPELGFDIYLRRDNIEDSSSSNAYKLNYKRMHYILSLYGVNESRIDSIIANIFDFLKAVTHIIEKYSNRYCDSIINPYDIDEETDDVFKLMQAYYEISWPQIDMPVKLKSCDSFFRQMIQICENRKEAVANYLSLKFLYEIGGRLTDKKFQKDFCLLEIRQSMTYLFNHFYMKTVVNNKTIDEVTTIAKELRRSLRAVLLESNWLDDESRDEALFRESTITDFIGRYEYNNLIESLIREIRKLKFTDNNYEANNLVLRQFRQYVERYTCTHKKKFTDLNLNPSVLIHSMQSNAWYDPMFGGLYVVYSTLQPPLFNIDWPNSLKFGTLGAFYGHELIHAYQFGGWPSTESAKIFENHSNCYVDYYNKYLVPEINRNINGRVTRNENMADDEGLRLALRAYRQYIKTLTYISSDGKIPNKEEQMPGLDLTAEQLFFLGYAQLLCSSNTEADYWRNLADGHTIDKYRVLGPLSNNEDFSKIYNCSLGSKMNPSIDKCKIW